MRKRERGYTHAMLAMRRRPEDCSCLPLLGIAGGATWWQVSESKWAYPRGTGPGFRRESRATAGPRDRRPAVSTMRARPRVRGAARSNVGRCGLRAATTSIHTETHACTCAGRGESGNVNRNRDRIRGSTAV